MIQDETWFEEQRKKFNDRLQTAINEEFSRTHDLIMQNLVPKETLKDKGSLRNINNYRMKFWCDVIVASVKEKSQTTHKQLFMFADYYLEEFDKRFNQ